MELANFTKTANQLLAGLKQARQEELAKRLTKLEKKARSKKASARAQNDYGILLAHAERFEEAVNSIANRYRTSKIGFRGVISAVRGWERLGFEKDPRKESFEMVQAAEIASMMDFHATHIKGKPKLISIVGDKRKIDMEALGKFGKITEVTLDDIFVK